MSDEAQAKIESLRSILGRLNEVLDNDVVGAIGKEREQWLSTYTAFGLGKAVLAVSKLKPSPAASTAEREAMVELAKLASDSEDREITGQEAEAVEQYFKHMAKMVLKYVALEAVVRVPSLTNAVNELVEWERDITSVMLRGESVEVYNDMRANARAMFDDQLANFRSGGADKSEGKETPPTEGLSAPKTGVMAFISRLLGRS